MTLADRPFAPASNQHNLEQYTGNYKDSTFVPTEPLAKVGKTDCLTCYGDLMTLTWAQRFYPE